MKTKKREARKSLPANSRGVNGSAPERAVKVDRTAVRRRKLWPYALAFFPILAAGFVVYGPALNGAFLFDDYYLPFSIPDFAVDSLWAWVTGVRPLLMFSYFINYQMSGL